MLKHLKITQKYLEKRLILFKITQKYLEKRLIILLNSFHAIKDNNIVHRKEINDSIQVKINNNTSSEKVIHENNFYIQNLKIGYQIN